MVSSIFFVGCKKEDVYKQEIQSFAKQQIGAKKIYLDGGLGCIQINFNELNINIYKDSVLPEDKAYFIYNSIPVKYLRKIEL